jgi:two-component system, NarL family, response regulator YdfI
MTPTVAVVPKTRVRIVAESADRKAFLSSLLAGNPEFEISAAATGSDDGAPPILIVDLKDDHSRMGVILPTARIGLVVLSDDDDFSWIADTPPKEPVAVLSCNCRRAQLLAAIRAVGEGFTVLEPDTLESLLRPDSIALEPGEEELTSRETEVLHMMTAGLTNREIAAALGISENTVKFHAASIFGKLGTSTRTEAVTEGIRRGLIVL